MSTYLPSIRADVSFKQNLTASRQTLGSGGAGITYLRVDKQTGAVTFGVDNTPLPPDHEFAVGLNQITHGYIVTAGPGGTMDRQHMIPLDSGARPRPPGDEYGSYEDGGPRDATEVILSSVQEPGFQLMFTAWGPSAANRVGTLLDQAIAHLDHADGVAGFVHPIVRVRSESYIHSKYGKIHHIGFEQIDWLHKDGSTRLSARKAHGVAVAADDDEDMTEAERELLRA